MVINGVDYGDKEIDFTNILCDFEDKGIDVMNMLGGESPKSFSLARAIVSFYTGITDLEECGKLLTAHLGNGGTFNSIVEPFTEAMRAAGFGQTETEEVKAVPTPKQTKAKTTQTEKTE